MMNLASVKMLRRCSFNNFSHEKNDLGISKYKVREHRRVLLATLVCSRKFAKEFLLDDLLFVIRCVCLETPSCGQFSLALVVSPPSRSKRLWSQFQFCS